MAQNQDHSTIGQYPKTGHIGVWPSDKILPNLCGCGGGVVLSARLLYRGGGLGFESCARQYFFNLKNNFNLAQSLQTPGAKKKENEWTNHGE